MQAGYYGTPSCSFWYIMGIWGPEEGKNKERLFNCIMEVIKFNRKPQRKRKKGTMEDYFQHQPQTSLSMHTRVHAHCEHDTHSFTQYTHTKLRPPYMSTHTWMLTCQHTYNRFSHYIHIHTYNFEIFFKKSVCVDLLCSSSTTTIFFLQQLWFLTFLGRN